METNYCTICLNTENLSEFKTTNCNHVFHNKCLEQWTNIACICPLCRTYLKDYFIATHKCLIFNYLCKINIDDNLLIINY